MSINIVNIVIFFKKTFILSQDFVSNIMMDRRTSPFKIYVLARLIV